MSTTCIDCNRSRMGRCPEHWNPSRALIAAPADKKSHPHQRGDHEYIHFTGDRCASDAGSVGALDEERLARALHLANVQCEHVTDRASCADGGWHRELAAAIAAAYERQGEQE